MDGFDYLNIFLAVIFIILLFIIFRSAFNFKPSASAWPPQPPICYTSKPAASKKQKFKRNKKRGY